MSSRWLACGLLGILLAGCNGSVGPPGQRLATTEIAEPAFFADSTLLTDVPRQPDRYALVIHLANYPANSGWEPLSSHRDAALLTHTLLRQGFPADQIRQVADAQATRQGILDALAALVRRVEPGAKVVIYYAGHGQQLADDNGDEIDGQDEALVPYDAPRRFVRTYTGDRHLRDDVLNGWVRRLREKVGQSGQVLLVFNACHSGTAVRGEGREKQTRPTWYEAATAADSRLGAFVLLSATMAEQEAIEVADEAGQPIGALTYGLCKALTTLGSAESYQAFFDRLTTTMSQFAPDQKPGLEGNVEAVVFGHGQGKAPPFFRVLRTDGSQVLLNGGLLHGLTVGTLVGFYTPDLAEPFTTPPPITGTIDQINTLTASVLLSSNGSSNQLVNSKVQVLSVAPGQARVRIRLDPSGRLLEPALSRLPGLVLGSLQPELTLRQRRGAYQLTTLPGDFVLYRGPDSTACIEAVKRYMRRKNLVQVELSDPTLLPVLTLQRVRVVQQRQAVQVLDTLPGYALGNLPSFSTNPRERVLVTLRNGGNEPFYFTLLDHTPDGTTVLLPEADHPAVEYKLMPGQQLTRRVRIRPPYGLEVYKVIVTHEPVDLRPLTRSAASVATDLNKKSDIALFFSDLTINGLLRGTTEYTPPSTIPKGSGTTLTYAFRVVKP